jgi:hypothetical protein
MRTAAEIAHDIAQPARIIAPRRVRRSVAVEVSAERSGRAITASQVINGSAFKCGADARSLFLSDEGKSRVSGDPKHKSGAKSGEFRG